MNNSAYLVMQSAAGATGDGTALECVPGDGAVLGTAVLQLSGTFTATVTFEATVDDSNWIAIQGTNLNAGTAASTATAAGLFRFNLAGLSKLRARVSAYTSGNVTVAAHAVDF